MKTTIATAVAIAVMPTAAAQAFSFSDYNLVVFGDLYSNSEVEGNAFIGGDLNGNSSNYCIKCSPDGSFTPFDGNGLKVVGDINGTPKNVNNGANVEYGDTLNAHINTNGGGTVTHNSDLASEFDALENFLKDTSVELAGLESNSSVATPGQQPGAVRFNSSGAKTAIFNIDISQLFSNKTQQIELDLNGSETAIINVSGTSASWNQGNMVGSLVNDATQQKVVWNFYEAEDLQFNNAFYGSLLAPLAHLTNQTELEGNVVVKSLQQNGEVHLPTFKGELPVVSPPQEEEPKSVPEPATALGLITILGFGAIRKRHRAQLAE
ncbi:MAG: choice-of-anchor A family protein [Leptolyngbya sp. SIO1D8]|nr:choice-of-anchor A family protein [Leptolyngbya sp. SIO1D8]